jgi:alpha-ketoglutarate-dependent taurine dioxygenase
MKEFINEQISKKGYVVLKNPELQTDEEIIDYYTNLNKTLGKIQEADQNKYENIRDNVWVDIKYNIQEPSIKPWNSNYSIKLHTDNTISPNYANLTQLVCLTPSPYSGHTCLIRNIDVIEIMKFLDVYENNNLFNKILDFEVNYKINSPAKKILTFKNNEPIFCFNYTQAMKSENNNEQIKIITEFDNFLHEKIMMSSLMDEIKLNRGDALIFNDEKVIHGRRSIIGNRHYIKCGILT